MAATGAFGFASATMGFGVSALGREPVFAALAGGVVFAFTAGAFVFTTGAFATGFLVGTGALDAFADLTVAFGALAEDVLAEDVLAEEALADFAFAEDALFATLSTGFAACVFTTAPLVTAFAVFAPTALVFADDLPGALAAAADLPTRTGILAVALLVRVGPLAVVRATLAFAFAADRTDATDADLRLAADFVTECFEADACDVAFASFAAAVLVAAAVLADMRHTPGWPELETGLAASLLAPRPRDVAGRHDAGWVSRWVSRRIRRIRPV